MLRISSLERSNDELEKSGYLTKLSGKLKTWRKRWFVLKNGTLSYWKSQVIDTLPTISNPTAVNFCQLPNYWIWPMSENKLMFICFVFAMRQSDVGRKAQGQIVLDDTCRVWRADGAATFEISTSKKTHYLTADSSGTVDEWVRILQNAVRRNTTRLLLGREDQKPTLEGWIVKVKHGHSKRCWCMLVGKTFLYFKALTDQVKVIDDQVFQSAFNCFFFPILFRPVWRFRRARSTCVTPASRNWNTYRIRTVKKRRAAQWRLPGRPT